MQSLAQRRRSNLHEAHGECPDPDDDDPIYYTSNQLFLNPKKKSIWWRGDR